MGLRFSKFIIAKELDENKYVLMSTISGSIIIIDKRLISLINSGNLPEEEKTCKELSNAFFLVDENFDEKSFLLEKFSRETWKNDTLDVTIAPSFACNFACPYCYEARDDRVMDEGTLKNLVRFIQGHLKKFDIGHFIMACYGGEPLLFPDHFRYIYEEISKTNPSVKISPRMTTNGSLLRKKLGGFMKSVPLERIQVTIHGDKKNHDSKRFYVGGKPSYEDVVNGIGEAINRKIPNIEIRVNIDLENISSLEGLLTDLEKRGFSNHENLRVYAYPVVHMTPESLGYKSKCLSIDSYFEKITGIIELINAYGFCGGAKHIRKYIKNLVLSNLCGVGTKGFYTVSPDGAIGTCWEFIGREGFEIGNVNFSTPIDCMKEKMWIDARISKVKRCLDLECPLVPSCAGGCVAQSFSERGDLGEPACFKKPEQIAEYLKFYADMSMRYSI